MGPHPQLIAGNHHVGNRRICKNVFRGTFFRGKAGRSDAQQHRQQNYHLFHTKTPLRGTVSLILKQFPEYNLAANRLPAVPPSQNRVLPDNCFTVYYSTDAFL